jgi:hypothetical protein
MNKDEVGRPCSVRDGDEKCMQNFRSETLREENT